MKEEDKYKIPELHRIILLGLMNIVSSVLDSSGIKYFIDGGTLLGAVREGGIIPHDDDIDIGVFHSDYFKLKSCLEKITTTKFIYGDKEYPIMLQITDPHMYKVYVPNLWVKNQYNITTATPTIDIFDYKKGEKIKLTSITQRQSFKNCYYLKTEMFPLKKYKFSNLELWGPSNGIPYLKRYYGNDCLEVVKIDKRIEGDFTHKDRNSFVQGT